MIPRLSAQARPILLPAVPALAVNPRHAALLTAEGELQTVPHEQARLFLHKQPVLLCHGPYTRQKLGLENFSTFDVLELFAFVHPAIFCTPTPAGLCKILGLPGPESFEDTPLVLMDIARALLSDIRKAPADSQGELLEIARIMGLQGKGWPWAPFVFDALGEIYDPAVPLNSKTALNVWKSLPEWAEEAPEPPPSHFPPTDGETQDRLRKLLGENAEERPEQKEYARNIAAAFAPLSPPAQGEEAHPPHIVLAEAGTGVGKTLGYLAPASVWAEKNKGTVWISTFTRNLQRQIDQELTRLYPDPVLKDLHTAVRKGRENYLCLLNLEDSANAAGLAHTPPQAVAAGLMARWAGATRDGDLTGADFPGWLPGLLGYAHTAGLADRRGECLYSACDHYRKCFVERSVRKAAHARIVVANHALVMIGAALSGPGETMPARYVFDEGHHLFNTADSAFSAHLTARETQDLRRWILGAEGGRRSRARGLKRRAEDLAVGDEPAERALRLIVEGATCLASENWGRRLKENIPDGPAEKFLALVYRQVTARTRGRESSYSLETEVFPLIGEMPEQAASFRKALQKLRKPMKDLAAIFRERLIADQGFLDSDTRGRLDAVSGALTRRADMVLQPWISMLESLEKNAIAPEVVQWMEIEKIDGRTQDLGLYRHHIDPMKLFADSLRPHVHGMAVTSATLRDSAQNEEQGWESAERASGTAWLSPESLRLAVNSPFDYAAQTKILVINDVRKDDPAQVAAAYGALFAASGGGALGLFTSIARLRAVQETIALPLEEQGIHLYSQHVDDIDAGTLVDMFREDENSCLLGTDAVRDGVDVPGRSLRLMVFDRVPWPRPTILHKARREAFGGRGYDEMLTRLKLKQAFARLIRRGTDRGVFVMLDSMLPSRLYPAFPEGVEIHKTGLAEAVSILRDFLK
ncbi:MAG: ATP-dependent DNA helicase [Alphaproteobacteria bacterium]|nr:ATP-dependent DNA helicase [Alphaproteobacteria bacterium]